MPVLVLARHAKAEAHSDERPDFDRALSLRGKMEAEALGAALAAAGFEPDLAYVSAAVRTAQTWEIAARGWDVPEVHSRRELYNTTVGTLIGVLAGSTADTAGVIVVGHEPTMSSAAAFLSGPGSDKTALQRVARGLPTGSAALLEFDGGWDEMGRGTARLRAVVGRDG